MILQEHYDSVLATELDKLGTFEEKNFDKAMSWAKNRYKPKNDTVLSRHLQGAGLQADTAFRRSSVRPTRLIRLSTSSSSSPS